MAADAPLIHDDVPRQHLRRPQAHVTDGVDEAFEKADVVVKQTIHNQRLIPCAIEPRGVVADWIDASDELTVYTSTQVPHFVRTFLAICCNVTEAKVRVIAPDVGGGFGSKLNCYAEEFIAAAVSHKLGAPVKWIEERVGGDDRDHPRPRPGRPHGAGGHEGRQGARHARPLRPGLRLLPAAADADDRAPDAVHGARRLRHPGRVDITVTKVFTNTVPTDAYRGAGRPEATHAIERMMDILAMELGMSRTEVRRRNFIDQLPVHDGDRPLLRLGRLPQDARQAARAVGRQGDVRAAARRGAGARQAARPRALDLRRDLRAGPVGASPTRSGSHPAAGRPRPCACTRPARSR